LWKARVTNVELPYQTINALLAAQEQGGRRLLAFAATRGSMAGLVLILSILDLAGAVLDTLHQRLPGIGYMLLIFAVTLCSARLAYGVYREGVRTAVEIICAARASALVRLNSRMRTRPLSTCD
jgi:hypothetical protein